MAPTISQPNPFDLHRLGEDALDKGQYERAARLFRAASLVALTTEGATTLLLRAREVEALQAAQRPS